MNTVKFNHHTALVVAHRGLSGIETENTASAFVAAGNRSYWGIETDVHVTADGQFVVHHDSTLLRVGEVDMKIAESTLAELQSVALIDKGGENRTDLRVATLSDYISICKKYEKHCVLELKDAFTDEQIAKIIDIIRGFDYLGDLTFISFNYENLLKVRKILPTQSVQFLFAAFTEEIIENLVRDKIDVDVHHAALDENNIKRLHELGIKINCYTVDSKERAENLALWGVDFITSNILE